MASDIVSLAGGWAPDRQKWEAATAAVLRKAHRLADSAPDSAVWSVLARSTVDGLAITPLGTPAASAGLHRPVLPAPHEHGGWDVRARFADPDLDVTADHVATDLENGVNSLWLAIGEGGIALDAVARVLEPVLLDLAPVVLDASDPGTAARALLRISADRGTRLHPRTNLGLRVPEPSLVEAARSAGIRAFVVDATAAHDRGASEAQELAVSFLQAARLLRELQAQGTAPAEAAPLIEFRYAATDEQFTTIAKLRAARRLWDRMLELCDVQMREPQAQHAVTSRPMFTKYDSYVNLLRGTVAAFAAGVAGAESVTVLPFDEPLGLPEAFSRRLARNTSTLLVAEAHVAKTADPAGGSYLVESLTDEIARAAWALLGELEQDHTLLDVRIEQAVSARARQIAERTRPITGVSEFPDLHEKLPERSPYPLAPHVLRYANEFEAMRDEPTVAPVFLATMGTNAQYTARASFAANLLAAGGIDVVGAGATANPEELVQAYAEAGEPDVVMLAGPDLHYADWGAEAIAALREAGAAHVLLAGKPGDLDADDSAALGLDALAFLRRVREVLR